MDTETATAPASTDQSADTVAAVVEAAQAPAQAPVEHVHVADTVPMVGHYALENTPKGYRLRGPDGKLISERFDNEPDARWYANRLTRLAGLWAAAAVPGGKPVYMPKVPGNVGQYTIAPTGKHWQVLDADAAPIGPVWTDKRNGKVDAFRFAERCVRVLG